MPIDLSNLKLIEENIEVDTDNYVDPSEFPPPIPDGTYLFKQGKPEFDVTGKGFLQAQFTHEVADGDQVGAKVSFDRISNKPFDRSGIKVNMMTDHLRAIGDRGRYRTHQEYADALAAGEGKTFKAQTQWEAGCQHKGTDKQVEWTDTKPEAQGGVFRLKNMKNFPSNGNGGYKPEATCTVCGAQAQARTRINLRVPSM